ncbi:MAG: DUF6531 domain-containing protein, partial [Methylococcales bacterium]
MIRTELFKQSMHKASTILTTSILFFLCMQPIVNAHVIFILDPQPDEPTPPPCPDGMCCNPPGSPHKIVYQSGRETFQRTDMVVQATHDMPIKITRVYASDSRYDSALGYGWSFRFNRRLFEYPDNLGIVNQVIVRHGCGNINRYNLTGGIYQPDTSIGSQNNALVKLANGHYTVTYPQGQQDEFDTQGRLVSTTKPNGSALVYSYNDTGKKPVWGSSPNTDDPAKSIISSYIHRLTKIQIRYADGGLGDYVDIAYTENTGRINTITANDGRVITYQHDATVDSKTLGNLTGVTGLENKVSIYKYEDKVGEVFQDYHNITHIQEGSAALAVNITYNNQDRAYIEQVGNSTWTFNFDSYPFATTVIETITDDAGNLLPSATNYYEFDEVGFVEFKRDALNNETRYVLDNHGNKLEEQIYKGSETTGILIKMITRRFDINSNQIEENIYDGSSVAGTLLKTTTTSYDGYQKSMEIMVSNVTPIQQFKTEWIYNRDNTTGIATTVLEERRYKDNGVDYLSTAYTYNSHGNVLTTTLADGHVMVNEYGAIYLGKYITKTLHYINGIAVTDLQESYTYDNKGNRTSVTDAKNHTLTTTYDALNRRKTVKNHLNHLTTYLYDARGNIAYITRDRTLANDQLDITKLTYDGENRLIKLERTDAAGAFIVTKQNTYDSSGALFSTTNSLNQKNTFSYDLLHRLNGITNYKNESISYTLDTLGNRTHEEVKSSSGVVVRSSDATYDRLNRQLTQIGATNNQTTTYTYDAADNRVSMTDALSRASTQYSYDTLSRLTNVLDANGKNTQYDYYDRGWLQTVTDPKNLVTTYNYNAFGQLDNLVSPDTGTTFYTYDLAGNKLTKKDARNITATYTYDELNRLKGITYPDATKNVTFTYDGNSFGLGKLSSMTDESG